MPAPSLAPRDETGMGREPSLGSQVDGGESLVPLGVRLMLALQAQSNTIHGTLTGGNWWVCRRLEVTWPSWEASVLMMVLDPT